MHSWIGLAFSVLVYIITFAIWIGKTQAREQEYQRIFKELNNRIDETTRTFAKQAESAVHKSACRIEMQNLERRLNEINSIDLGARLARMETKIDNIETTLKERKS